jgi:parallel beta-helix repeat protein
MRMLLIALIAGLNAASAAQTTIHVSPVGDDGADGTEARPLRSLEAARDMVRSRRASDPDAACTIRLAPGDHLLTDTVLFEAVDSGTEERPLTIVGAPGRASRLLGGVTVPPEAWAPVSDEGVRARFIDPAAPDHVLVADLDALGVGDFGPLLARGFPQPIRPAPPELFFAGEPMTLARYPNDGFLTTGTVLDPGSTPREGDDSDRLPVFEFIDDRHAAWADAPDAWLVGYWKWDWADESIPVGSIDAEAKTVTLAAPHHYSVDAGKHYFAENLLEEIDSPGEYHLDRENARLYFWPPAGIESAECLLSTLDAPMIRFEDVEHATLEMLTLECSRADGVVVEGGRDVLIAGCTIRNLGNRAAVVKGGEDHRVWSCDIEQTGEGGVSISGGDRATLTPCRNQVGNCRIRDFSRRAATYRPGVSIGGVGCFVTQCEIFDAPHSAIIFTGNDHTIGLNDIHHVLTRTGDGGAVYCGRDWTIRGTRIVLNHFHDIVGLRKWECAVYVDDQASGIIIENNLFSDCHWGMLMGGGRDNVIKSNVFVDCTLALHFDARGLGWAARTRTILEERLAAVPYLEEPWSTAFPELIGILDDDPMTPKGNVIRGNVLVRSERIDSDMAAQVRAFGTIAGNVVTDEGPRIEGRSLSFIRALIDAEILDPDGRWPQFVVPIGNLTDRYRQPPD